MSRDAHALAEERSLAYHREVAARLRSDPALVERARAHAESQLRRGGRSRPWFERWCEILAQSPEEIARVLVDPGEEARALRQSTPFAGALPPRERWRIWRATRERWEST